MAGGLPARPWLAPCWLGSPRLTGSCLQAFSWLILALVSILGSPWLYLWMDLPTWLLVHATVCTRLSLGVVDFLLPSV